MKSVRICVLHQKGKSHRSVVISLQFKTKMVGNKACSYAPSRKSASQLARMSHPTQRWYPGEGDVAVGEEPQENEEMKTFQHYTDVSKAFPSAASIKNLELATRTGFMSPQTWYQSPVTEQMVSFLKTQNHSQVLFNDGCKKRVMYSFSPEVVGRFSICSDVADFMNKINENAVPDKCALL